MPPTDQDLDQLVEELAPLVQRLFLDSGIPELEAEQMVRDALVRLCYRWDRIKDREGWLLRTLAKEVRAPLDPPGDRADRGARRCLSPTPMPTPWPAT